ncbi:hypothetical protein [Micromonospora pallida]|uniref:hypothetical protein n=1 Tax=Micromonospora pallida TaxID=145854 RepID=UPI001FE0D54A|nr:hypothetical protein [Micromonospora pallida]
MKLVEMPGGGVTAWRVSIDTGGWESADDLIEEILFAVGGEIFSLSSDDFVQEVERYRARYLNGDGPIFALYETVKAIVEAERSERRYLTDRERALVRGIRRKTFVMFEEQLKQQGDPGADPSLGE